MPFIYPVEDAGTGAREEALEAEEGDRGETAEDGSSHGAAVYYHSLRYDRHAGGHQQLRIHSCSVHNRCNETPVSSDAGLYSHGTHHDHLLWTKQGQGRLPAAPGRLQDGNPSGGRFQRFCRIDPDLCVSEAAVPLLPAGDGHGNGDRIGETLSLSHFCFLFSSEPDLHLP